MAILLEKQNFERNFSRKKLFPHYLFNNLEYISAKFIDNLEKSELFDKLKFLLYYFLVDAENDWVELEKEILFCQYYIDLEIIKLKYKISVHFNIVGSPNNYRVIPLLFEPLISNAMKYTKRDGTGWVYLEFNVSDYPTICFCCRNNFSGITNQIVSLENGLKILKQRLDFCFKNKYSLKINQNIDLYEVILTIALE